MLTWPTGRYAPGYSRYNTLVLPYEFLVQFEIQKMSRLKTAKKKEKENQAFAVNIYIPGKKGG